MPTVVVVVELVEDGTLLGDGVNIGPGSWNCGCNCNGRFCCCLGEGCSLEIELGLVKSWKFENCCRTEPDEIGRSEEDRENSD